MEMLPGCYQDYCISIIISVLLRDFGMNRKKTSKARFFGSFSNDDKVESVNTRTSDSPPSETRPTVNFREDTVDFFYLELLRYVLDEFSIITKDKLDDSDEEPTYYTNSRPDSEDIDGQGTDSLKQTQRIISRSRLRSHILATQSHGHFDKYKSQMRTQDVPLSDEKLTKIRYKRSMVNSEYRDRITTMGEENRQDSAEPVGVDPFRESHHTYESGDTSDNVEKRYTNSMILNKELFQTDNATKQLVNIKFSTGMFFSGELQHYRFNGTGMLKSPEGASYTGEFKEGKITGFGKLVYLDGSYYEGTFINGSMQGTGNFYPSHSSTSYSGEWANSIPHGIGHLRYSETDFYDGSWVNGRREGLGTHVYDSKAAYIGNWKKGKPSGKGTMVYTNRDLYHGEWANGKPNGVGQYIWNATLNEGLVYKMVNSYTGHFVNGMRDGYGVQSFGMEGSKLASIFDNNMKSGAGILVFGNGTSIQRKPLFLMNKPLPAKAATAIEDSSMSQLIQGYSISTPRGAKSTYHVMAKEPYTTKMLQMLSKGNAVIKSVERKGLPLNIPLHANAKDINLTYHVARFLNHFYNQNINESMIDENITVSRASIGNFIDKQNDSMIDVECRLLRRTIANNYVYLHGVYQKYASSNPLHACVPESRNPVMSRLKLYQFLRDIGTYKFNMSLLDVDNAMLEIPQIGLESEHDPFEQIYMWQFMHCILILSYAMYDHTQLCEKVTVWCDAKLHHLQKCRYHDILKNFIQTVIKPKDCKFEGRVLFACKDVLPIKQVYELYKAIGEPHTARTLLCRICHKKGEPSISCIPSYRKIYGPRGTGKHFVLGDVNILYLSTENKLPWHMEESLKWNRYEDDPFYTDLRVFRNLGPELVVKCITSICPMILEDGVIVRIDYLLTFLEFYEILINLAEELGKVKKEEEKKYELENMERIRTSKLKTSSLSSNAKSDPGKLPKKNVKKRKAD